GEVDEIDPNATPASGDTRGKITRIFPTTCGPAGLVLIPGQRLMTSCGDVLEVATGTVKAHVTGVAADEIWFNSGDNRVYFGRTTPFIVSALPPFNLLGTLPTTPPPLAANQTTHSIAADSENNRIFVPFANLGVMVFTADQDKDDEQ